MGKKLSILLPVRNEGVNLKIMIKILKSVLNVDHEIVVIYDYPDDNSIQVVKDLQVYYSDILLIHNNLGKGVTNAIRTGVIFSKGEFILIFAADEVGPVVAIDDMIALADQGCDFISCTRYAYGGRRLGGSFIGGFLSIFANKLFTILSNSCLTDSTTGIKMFRRSIFFELDLQSKPIGWAVAFELSIKIQLAGKMVGETPIISVDRLYGGKSTFHLGSWVYEYLRWFIWGIVSLRKKYKFTKFPVLVRMPSYLVK